MNEFCDVAVRKYGCSWAHVHEVLSLLRSLCLVRSITVETHDLALAISERHKFRIYDSLVIASAIQGDCTTLFSEDMQDGQTVGSVMIRNPFAQTV